MTTTIQTATMEGLLVDLSKRVESVLKHCLRWQSEAAAGNVLMPIREPVSFVRSLASCGEKARDVTALYSLWVSKKGAVDATVAFEACLTDTGGPTTAQGFNDAFAAAQLQMIVWEGEFQALDPTADTYIITPRASETQPMTVVEAENFDLATSNAIRNLPALALLVTRLEDTGAIVA